MRTKTAIAGLVYPQVNAVLFGLGIIATLLIPTLKVHAMTVLPIVIASSLVLSVPLTWWIAPRLRLRYWRSRRDAPYGGR
ncbi:hypothetical protein C8N35_101747 [Breoghania corrubedonensis]|uniref:Uncharacterized protein n=1 Tax=Breoghania corrubedonensis TaxID=665038 RepID=A0A2T5VG30_9HYPH|nr:hypothetical protein [Breoghania corrubedonensis]PTW62700.1 hypothetical protein C8N35_101747 [Breoghania corrubedonensis]